MKYIIEAVDNGWILKTGEEKRLFSYDDSSLNFRKEQCKAMAELFWEILDKETPYSKHSDYNVKIFVEDKYGKEIEI